MRKEQYRKERKIRKGRKKKKIIEMRANLEYDRREKGIFHCMLNQLLHTDIYRAAQVQKACCYYMLIKDTPYRSTITNFCYNILIHSP